LVIGHFIDIFFRFFDDDVFVEIIDEIGEIELFRFHAGFPLFLFMVYIYKFVIKYNLTEVEETLLEIRSKILKNKEF